MMGGAASREQNPGSASLAPPRSRRLALFGATWLAACAASPAPAPDAYAALQGEIFGSTWSITWAPADAVPAASLQPALEKTLADLDAHLSTWRPDSDLSRLKDGPRPVDEDTAALIDLALDVAAASDGAFDPTVQPLMHLWGFRGGEPRTEPPSDADLSAARARVGWQRVRIDRSKGRPILDAGGTDLDVAAIAPGWAADRLADVAAAAGATDIYVDVGGEAVLRGRAPSGRRWRIGVDRPAEGLASGAEIAAVVELSNAGVATSGNYRNHRSIAGTRYGHTMDPRTGRPVTHEVASVTVVAPTAAEADAWATVLMVLDLAAGQELVSRHAELDAMWLVARDGKLHQELSAGMHQWLPTPKTR